jgi:hypothetical protein
MSLSFARPAGFISILHLTQVAESGIVYGNGVEHSLAPFPVGHTAGKQLVKASGVVEVQPVAEFLFKLSIPLSFFTSNRPR